MLDKFKPEVHGGEVAGRDPQGLGDLVRSADHADAEEADAETPPLARTSAFFGSWVPVAELFNRLAGGATLEQILEACHRSVVPRPLMRYEKRHCGFRRTRVSTRPSMSGRRGIRTNDDLEPQSLAQRDRTTH